MPTSKWPFFASEELGKKNDDHRPMTHPEQQWRPKSWKLPRRRRILLLPVILYLLYIFFKNMPTDLPPARERLKPTIPSSQHVLPDAAPPPGTSLSNPPPRDESSSGNSDELYYNGKLKFYELGKSLKLFQASSNHGGKAASHSAVFAAASLRSVSDLLPLACSMANRKLNKVHFLLMGRDEVSIEGIQSVNGVSRADCPINWHDARVDYGRWSTDARMEHAVAVVLPYIQAYLRPEILITQGDSWEDPFFMRGIQKAKELGIPHIKLPHAARDLMWLAALDSNALRSWNDIQVEFLIYAAPDSAGSLIRLLRSLEHADFLGYTPSLTIELPSRVDPQLLGFLQELKWLPNTSSKVTIRRRVQLHTMDPNEASLRAVEAFYPRNPTLSHVLVLSPDVELAPSFFQYLIYTLLNYRYSTSSRMLSSKLMGISLELPSSRLTDTEPFKQPDIDETHFSNQNNPETLPLFLWQAPNSNAALYFGDKWVELHSFLARRLTAEEVAPGVSQDEKVISKRYPAFMEYLHELLRARGYYLLYPAFSAKGRFSVAKFHDDLFQFPEEFSDGNSEGLQQPKSAEMLLSGAPTLMPLLDTFSLELPDTSRLPILTDRGEEISSLVLERETENYVKKFRGRYGGCSEDSLDHVLSTEELFCSSE